MKMKKLFAMILITAVFLLSALVSISAARKQKQSSGGAVNRPEQRYVVLFGVARSSMTPADIYIEAVPAGGSIASQRMMPRAS
jgi:hypothetical protein